ncbi:hypothetical protein FJU08_20000 [Martelella alba]|uniref:Uncharacterized protein n=1 Tax=Martelella alba TaxID=2590451 RepID=A0A506TZJ2_9HYPH|nr:hypothetical protein [Martelella alba]TPW27502.1 hypothetical protein FJU08_20000 [Martelella alba]
MRPTAPPSYDSLPLAHDSVPLAQDDLDALRQSLARSEETARVSKLQLAELKGARLRNRQRIEELSSLYQSIKRKVRDDGQLRTLKMNGRIYAMRICEMQERLEAARSERNLAQRQIESHQNAIDRLPTYEEAMRSRSPTIGAALMTPAGQR